MITQEIKIHKSQMPHTLVIHLNTISHLSTIKQNADQIHTVHIDSTTHHTVHMQHVSNACELYLLAPLTLSEKPEHKWLNFWSQKSESGPVLKIKVNHMSYPEYMKPYKM